MHLLSLTPFQSPTVSLGWDKETKQITNECPKYLDNLYIFKEKVRSLVPPALLTALATCGMSDTIAFVDAAYPAARCTNLSSKWDSHTF